MNYTLKWLYGKTPNYVNMPTAKVPSVVFEIEGSTSEALLQGSKTSKDLATPLNFIGNGFVSVKILENIPIKVTWKCQSATALRIINGLFWDKHEDNKEIENLI